MPISLTPSLTDQVKKAGLPVVAALASTLLVGCGLKDDLVLPEREQASVPKASVPKASAPIEAPWS